MVIWPELQTRLLRGLSLSQVLTIVNNTLLNRCDAVDKANLSSYLYFSALLAFVSELYEDFMGKWQGTFMKCHPCTLFKETRFGAPGIRATTDPAVLADAKTAHEKQRKVRRSIVYIVIFVEGVRR